MVLSAVRSYTIRPIFEVERRGEVERMASSLALTLSGQGRESGYEETGSPDADAPGMGAVESVGRLTESVGRLTKSACTVAWGTESACTVAWDTES